MSHRDNPLYQITPDDLRKVEEFSREKQHSVLVVFFDDIKNSTTLKEKLTAAQDEGVFQDLREEHDKLLTGIICRESGGRIIKSTGDGLLAVIDEPTTAVLRSIEIQEKLSRHPYLSVRIGLDMGQIRVESAGGTIIDVFGRHVDWAARAESLADGGHIIVTRSVYNDAYGYIPKNSISWKAHGFYVVKEGEEAIEAFEPYNANITTPMPRLTGRHVSQPVSHTAQINIDTSKDIHSPTTARTFSFEHEYLEWWVHENEKRTETLLKLFGTDIMVDRTVFSPEPRLTYSTSFVVARLPNLNGKCVLDLGTGSGVLAILAVHRGAKHVLAVDIDSAAIDNCVSNVNSLCLSGQIDVIRSDLFEKVEGDFDIILANLPMARDVWDHVPGTPASTARRFISEIRHHLRPEGHVLLPWASFAEIPSTEMKTIITDAGLRQRMHTESTLGIDWFLFDIHL